MWSKKKQDGDRLLDVLVVDMNEPLLKCAFGSANNGIIQVWDLINQNSVLTINDVSKSCISELKFVNYYRFLSTGCDDDTSYKN